MTGCIYKLPDGRCDKPGKYMAFCIGEACSSATPSNYDRIVSMTPEELAEFVIGIMCKTVKPYMEIREKVLRDDEFLGWLKSPVEVDNG